jgi:hypothetical protein
VTKREDGLNLSASCAVVDLVALLTALVRPWDVSDGDEEEGVAGVSNTSEGVVPEVLLVQVLMILAFRTRHTKQ